MLLSLGLNKYVRSQLVAERKRRVRLTWGDKSFCGKFLFGARKSLFLGMHQFYFMSEASWETVTFVFYLFYAIVSFYFFLIPTQ